MQEHRRNRTSGDWRVLLIVLVVALVAWAVFVTSPSSAAPPHRETPECTAGVDLYGFSDALDKTTFGGTEVGGLSGITYDAQRNVYYALEDNQGTTASRFYTLRIKTAGKKVRKPKVLDVTILRDESGQPFTGANFDGEGIALTPDGELLISSETEPSIRRFALDGTYLGNLPVPDRYLVEGGEGQPNQTFEGLSVSPEGDSLFTVNEGYLSADGETAAGGDRLRILRYENDPQRGLLPTEEFYYQADPELGVAEIVALSENELLVLERGFQAGVGNTMRIYRVSLHDATDVSGIDSLATSDVERVQKELLVDLSGCPSSGATTAPGATQANPLLDNFESLALGPPLRDGRRSLVLASDDNFSSGQTTRVIVLAAEGDLL